MINDKDKLQFLNELSEMGVSFSVCRYTCCNTYLNANGVIDYCNLCLIEFKKQIPGYHVQCEAITIKGDRCKHIIYIPGYKNIGYYIKNRWKKEKLCVVHENMAGIKMITDKKYVKDEL